MVQYTAVHTTADQVAYDLSIDAIFNDRKQRKPILKVTPILDAVCVVDSGGYLGPQWITSKNLHTPYSSV